MRPVMLSPPECSASEMAVSVQNLSKVFRTGNQTVTAVDKVSFSATSGEFVSIMGASGSGKTTLLHLLAGLMLPTSGSVNIDNVNLSALSDQQRTHFRRENIGVIFQAFNLIPTLSAEENILLPAMIAGKKKLRTSDLEDILEILEIKERRHFRPDSLSGGEQQRVAIGRALFMNPKLLLADEPTGNLDSQNSQSFCKLLRHLCDTRKRTIILVTHENSVAHWSDRRILLKDGKIQNSLNAESIATEHIGQ